MREISKLERVPLKEVWKNETGFTKWLEENIEVLNDASTSIFQAQSVNNPLGHSRLIS